MMQTSTSRLLLLLPRTRLRAPLKANAVFFNEQSLPKWVAASSTRSFFGRKTYTRAHHSTGNKAFSKACCSSSTRSIITTNPREQHRDETGARTCPSKSAAYKPSSSSSLPITSGQFWSDPRIWKTASVNTFRCLVGCTLGDMSMLFYLQSAHPDLSPGIAMALAMSSGILTSISLETILLRFSRASNMPWREAFKTATGMSLISMLTMEAVENAVDYHLMGWGNVNLSDPIFWKAVGYSALAGWSAPLPFNYWNLKRHGKSCH